MLGLRFKTVNVGAGKSLVSPDGEVALTGMVRPNESEAERGSLWETAGWAEHVACAPKWARGVPRLLRQCGRPCQASLRALALCVTAHTERRSRRGVLGAASLQWRKA